MQLIKIVFRLGMPAIVFAMVAGASAPAAAQGFLDGLFGLFAPKPKPSPPPAMSRPDFGDVRPNPFEPSYGAPTRFGNGRYKTMCVRLCDGYYFPISNATSRRSFWQDAQQCQSRCSSETQLFYMPTSGGAIEEARSVTGLAYEDLKNAFRYRKTLDKSCTCRPDPWSVAERQRHARYAMIEAGTPVPAPTEVAARDDGALQARTEPGAGDGTPVDGQSIGGTDAADRAQGLAVAGGAPGVTLVQPVAVRPRPVQRLAPAYGLGGSFAGSPVVSKPARRPTVFKSHWPGIDGN